MSNEDVSIGNLRENDMYQIQLRNDKTTSSIANVTLKTDKTSFSNKIWKYLIWLTAMLGFWATMSLSIADITRYSSSQKAQIQGQFIGLPGTMMLYSFVGIFVTYAAIISFDDILIANDAPWDPIALLAKFDNVWVVVIAQIFMIIATLSTNIAANVIAPANAFSNLLPKKISFKTGGYITGIIGILIFPWLLLNEIQGLLIDVSAVLGPVLAILVCDYYLIRKKEIQIADLYKENGIYAQVHYIPVHQLPYYQKMKHQQLDLKCAENYYQHCLSLPMFPSLTTDEQDFVIDKVLSFING